MTWRAFSPWATTPFFSTAIRTRCALKASPKSCSKVPVIPLCAAFFLVAATKARRRKHHRPRNQRQKQPYEQKGKSDNDWGVHRERSAPSGRRYCAFQLVENFHKKPQVHFVFPNFAQRPQRRRSGEVPRRADWH